MWLSTPPGWGKKKSLTMAMLYGILMAFEVGDPSRSGLRTEQLHHEHLIHITRNNNEWGLYLEFGKSEFDCARDAGGRR